nr:alpha/beta hydrolase [Motilibacter deserti]
MLHAFPLSPRMFDQARLLLEPDVRVLVPGLAGFGGTPVPAAGPSLDVLADEVAALLDEAGLASAVVCGVSMGAYVALALARRHPARLRGLVLASSRAGADAPEARERRERIARAVLAERDVRVLHEEVAPGLLGATTHEVRPDVVEDVRRLVGEAPVEAVAWAQRAMAARPDSTDVLADVRVPALVLVGEEDAIVPVDEARAIAAALPVGRLMAVPGAGHLVPLERPAEFAAAVTQLVQQVVAQRGGPA